MINNTFLEPVLVAFFNLASADKRARVAQINTDIGAGGSLLVYTGFPPVSPDYASPDTLLVSLPLSTPAAVDSYGVQSLAIVNPGTGGVTGAQMITGMTGSGTLFQAAVTVSDGGTMVAITDLISPGAYTVPPLDITNEPITGGGLTNASVSLVLTGQLTFAPITDVVATVAGTAGYARITNVNGMGIVDLDCGTSANSVVMNTTTITIGAVVSCSVDIFIEA